MIDRRRFALYVIPAWFATLASGRGTAAIARDARPRRVVIVAPGTAAHAAPFLKAFEDGLRESTQLDPKMLVLDVRYAPDPAQREATLRSVVAEQPDVIVVAGLSLAKLARGATSVIPIVVATASDLVDGGVVASYRRPGGNITGVSDLVDEVTVKRLELVREALPRATRVALLTNPDFPATPKIERRVAEAAPRLGLTVTRWHGRDKDTIAKALGAIAQSRADVLLIGADPLFNSAEFMQAAAALRIPVFHYWQGTAELGALLTYEVDALDNFRRAAGYVDRILKGANPGDLPIHQPTSYRLVVNARVAQALGVELPATLLGRADEVIR